MEKREVEGGMYTDLWEIWDVTLIYSNLLSSFIKGTQNKIKTTKKEGGGGGKMENIKKKNTGE